MILLHHEEEEISHMIRRKLWINTNEDAYLLPNMILSLHLYVLQAEVKSFNNSLWNLEIQFSKFHKKKFFLKR